MRDFGNGKFAAMRMAVREEGETIHAYVAQTHTMDDAWSVLTMDHAIGQLPGVHEAFMALVEAIGKATAEAMTGLEVCSVHNEEPPEHERAGHA